MIYQKEYNDYDDYILQQGYKAINHKDYVLKGKKKRIRTFNSLFKKMSKYFNQGSVLCLGARDGSEVEVLKQFGFDAVGIDLFSLDDKVIKADWHNLPFRDGVFDNIFTNSLDHCFDFELMLKEIKRILVYGGRLMIRTDAEYCFYEVKKEGLSLNEWMERRGLNAMFWDLFNDVVSYITGQGFSIKFFKQNAKEISLVVEKNNV